MYEKCGVIGIYSLKGYDVVPMLIIGLESLQHRGQEAWGIAVKGHSTIKKLGIVTQFIDSNSIAKISGNVGIGHVRYSTTAKSILKNAHPLDIGSRGEENGFRLAHNGTLEREPLIKNLNKEGCTLSSGVTDSELMGINLYEYLKRGKMWTEAFKDLSPYFNGSFSLIILTNKGELISARDERGFRPLCLGWHEESESYIIASESCALDALDARLIRDVKPGEIITVNDGGIFEERFSVQTQHAHCPFEYTYFANPSSVIEGINVYLARKKIGRKLAEKYPLDGDIVVPVPDSARPAALGYSEKSGIKFEEGLIKDRYRRKGSWRSFIEPRKREDVVSNIIAIEEAIKGKRVILIDDSIVRGTSSRIIVGKKLKAAKEVSLLLTFPPIMYPCYAGIDFPSREELLVYKVCRGTMDLDEINQKIGRYLGVSFLGYNDVKGLSDGIGIPSCQMCLSCSTGDYGCLKRRPNIRKRREMKDS